MDVGKVAALAVGVGFFAFAPGAQAAVLVEQLVGPTSPYTNQITGITGDTHLTGDTRLFLARKTGHISVYDMATNSFSAFQDLSAHAYGNSNDELGLLGMVFDPSYASNGQYYVYLTGQTAPGGPIEAQVLRFTDPAIAVGAETSIWKMDLDGATNHIGGWIGFDQGGKLLIAIGDGGIGSYPDIRHTGQDPSDWFGSILRIDPDADAFPGDNALNYAVPSDNPAIPGGAGEVYAYGLRNPFRNSVAPDGNLIIADVGQGDREELTILAPDDANRNLGWSLREGELPTPIVGGAEPADYQAPGLAYDHSEGAAIIGGFVYRGSDVPELYGRYVFGDQVSGNIWSIGYEDGHFTGSKTLLGNIPSLVSFGETADGELVATQFDFGAGGGIYHFISDGNFAAVPEPASWTMMIAGFALLGGALRRSGWRPAGRNQAAARLV